jgi:hypothetical protein
MIPATSIAEIEAYLQEKGLLEGALPRDEAGKFTLTDEQRKALVIRARRLLNDLRHEAFLKQQIPLQAAQDKRKRKVQKRLQNARSS